MYRNYVILEAIEKIININSQRDIFDWISIITSIITAIATFIIAFVMFYYQFLMKIRVKIEFFNISNFEGNKMSIQILNPSILFNRLIQDIYLVMDDFFIINLNQNYLNTNYKTGKIEAINIKQREVKRVVFSYTSINICNYETDIGEFVNQSYRLSFFLKDAFGKYYKIPFVDDMKNNPKSKLSIRNFVKKLNNGEFQSFGYYRKLAGDKIVDDNVIFLISVHNMINGSQTEIYVDDNGNLSKFIYDSYQIPKEVLKSKQSLYDYLVNKQKEFGIKDEVFYIFTLSEPRKRSEKFKTVREIRSEYLKNTVPYNDVYKWILVKKENNIYMGWSNSIKKPASGEPDKLEWFEWNRPLPYDINNQKYVYRKGKLKYKK